MNILFNKKFLKHNPDSYVEGPYRIEGFEDRLLGLNYTLEGYLRVGKRLAQSFDHIFSVLEGGYHLQIRQCVDHFIRGVGISH